MRRDWQALVRDVLDPLPTEEGGIAIVLATSGTPPAVAMLSSGDVWVASDRVRVGVHGTSSTASRLGGAFTLLVPGPAVALRVEVVDATATPTGRLALLEGRLHDVRPTTERPWTAEMRFRPSSPTAPGVREYVRYWAAVRDWLDGTDPRRDPPTTPDVRPDPDERNDHHEGP